MMMLRTLLAFMPGVLALTACAEVEGRYETRTPPQYLTLEPSQTKQTISPARLAAGPASVGAAVDQIVRQFTTTGSGRLHLVVSAPSGDQARRDATVLTRAFADRGLNQDRLTVTTVNVPPHGAVGSYQRLDVALPHCPDVPLRDSPLGCGLDRQLGKMIARNSDLLGNDRIGVNPSQPTGAALDRYRSNQPPPIIPSGLPDTTNID